MDFSRVNGRFGRYQRLEALPAGQPLVYKDFGGGIDLRDVKGDVSPDSSPAALDVESSRQDRLKRIHGVTTGAIIEDKDVEQLAVHASLDYTAELLMIAPPYLGVRSASDTQWLNVGLPSGPRYGWVNVGGTFLLSNTVDNKVFARQAGATTIEALTKAQAARSYVSFAGRVLGADVIFDGNRERMGVAWNGSDGSYSDWTGLGNGFELLIDDMSVGDQILAQKTLGFDLMVFICRNSLWVGQRTGQRNRPVHFQPRVPKLGAVNAAVCASTRFGVIFLHDSGVWLFDGNSVQHLSPQIDSELLPIDFDQLDSYAAAYSPKSQKYYLFTPSCTWALDLSRLASEQRVRWWKMSLIAKSAVLWSEQFTALTWDEMTGNWDSGELTWDDMLPSQSEAYKMWFLTAYGEEDQAIGYEDEGMNCYMQTIQKPFYRMPLVQGFPVDQMLTTKNLVLNYRGFGRMGVRQPALNGSFLGTAVYDLPSLAEDSVAQLPYVHTGMGSGLQLDWGADSCVEVSRAELEILPRSSRINETPIERVVGVADYDNLSTL